MLIVSSLVLLNGPDEAVFYLNLSWNLCEDFHSMCKYFSLLLALGYIDDVS
jgi:hypothetical protein